MKCPQLSKVYSWGSGDWDLAEANCLQGECAWWYSKLKMCSVAVLAVETRLASETQTYILLELQRMVAVKKEVE